MESLAKNRCSPPGIKTSGWGALAVCQGTGLSLPHEARSTVTLCGPLILPGAGGCILPSSSWRSRRPVWIPGAAWGCPLCWGRLGTEAARPGRAQGQPPGSREKQPHGPSCAKCSQVRLQKVQPASHGPLYNPERLGTSHSPALQL